MKSNPKLKRNDFWKIVCLDCGINCELLTDSWKRVICHECLVKYEFNEVENEIYAESDSEVDEERREKGSEKSLLRDTDLAAIHSHSVWLQELIERNGKVE